MNFDFSKIKQFDCTLDGKPFDVYAFTVEDRIFSNYAVSVTVVANGHLNIHDFIDKKGVLTLLCNGHTTCISGMITSFRQDVPIGRYTLFTAVLTPSLWNLTLIRDMRIFQDMSVPDIIADVLRTSGLATSDYEYRFKSDYRKREYTVQFRETNMAFITRLMAEEGMFFYHEFKEDGHLLVFGDGYESHLDIPNGTGVIYSEKGQLMNQDECVTRFMKEERITAGKIEVGEFYFRSPSYQMLIHRSDNEFREYEHYDHPAPLTDEKNSRRYADAVLESETWKRQIIHGESTCRRFAAGHIFKLTGIFNTPDKEYIITSVTHTGKQPQALKEIADQSEGNTYGNTFTCIPYRTTFRPDRYGYKPTVMGVQTATVTGPETEEIYTDEYGRVKVRFHWDRQGKKEDRSSCWIRVAQSFAGYGFGAMFIPRIGHEVIVSFIDGDPDKPIITGSVYNGKNITPYKLPGEKTKSTIKTETTPGGKGFNEIRFEDLKGQEEIYIHGQKDWNIEILNDKSQSIGHDEKLDVKNDRVKTVGHDQKEEVKNDKTITVGKNHTESVGENMSVKVDKNLDEHTAENKTVTVGKNLSETISENADISIKGNETLDIEKNCDMTVRENTTGNVGKDLSIRVSGNTAVAIDRNMSMDTRETVTETAGKNFSITSSGGDVIIRAGGATITITKSGEINLDGASVTMTASGKIAMKGSNINQN